MKERPTPETDAAWSCFKGYTELLQDVKDLSRKLERERDEAREELAEWNDSALHVRQEYDDEQHCSCVPILRKLLKDAERERDEAREERDFFAEEIKRMQEHMWKLHLVISMQSKTLSKHGLEEYIL